MFSVCLFPKKIVNLEHKSVCSCVARLAVKLIAMRLGDSHKYIPGFDI